MILPMNTSHLDAVAALELRCFTQPYSRALLAAELDNPNALYLVDQTAENKLRGYAGLNVVLDEGHITTVATAPEHRRLGIAHRLIGRLITLARLLGLSQLQLEVRESNIAALALYRQFDFAEVGRRRRYYDNPKEDAVLMTLTLEAKP